MDSIYWRIGEDVRAQAAEFLVRQLIALSLLPTHCVAHNFGYKKVGSVWSLKSAAA